MFAKPPFVNSMPVWVLNLKRPLQIGFAAALLTAIITMFMPNY